MLTPGRSQRRQLAVEPNIGSELLPTPPAFDAPVSGWGEEFPSEYFHGVWYGKKLEWLGYPMVITF